MATWSCEIVQGALVCSGLGLFSGKHSTVRFSQLEPREYSRNLLHFKGADYEWGRGASLLPFASAPNRHTELQLEHGILHCTEHLFAALAFFMDQNLRIEVIGDEIPILDGSAWPWFKALLDWGLCPALHSHEVKVLPGSVYPSIQVERSNQLEMECFWHGARYSQSAFWKQDFSTHQQLLRARTFIDSSIWQELDAQGFFPGAHQDSGLVYSEKEEGIVFPFGHELRTDQEFAFHKMLDFMGDMALLGWIPALRIRLERAGHQQHLTFLKGLDYVFA